MKKLNKNKKFIREMISVGYKSRTEKQNNDKIIHGNKELINLSSNDYLGLSKNKKLIEVSNKWTENFGTSLSSSRMISGNIEKIEEIEDKISNFSLNQKTLIMGSGFQTNVTLIPAIIGNSLGKRKKTHIFSDKLNHASINYGCYITNQMVNRYFHLDLNNLEYLLKKSSKDVQKIIISETVFSMDGDILNIEDIRFLAKKYNCFLYLDEAHALGVFGDKGFGLASKNKKVDNEIIVGTFGKAFGSYGSFVSCSKEISEKIINYCGGLIYSTVLPPAILGSISAAVELMPNLKKEREKLIKKSKFLHEELTKIGIDIGNSTSQIIPLILKNIKACNDLRDFLFRNGFFVKVIKSPTVPIGKERIRLSLTATLNEKVIKKLVNSIFKFKKK